MFKTLDPAVFFQVFGVFRNPAENFAGLRSGTLFLPKGGSQDLEEPLAEILAETPMCPDFSQIHRKAPSPTKNTEEYENCRL